MRIHNPSDLSRRRKEILVNKRVVLGQKDSESWMRVIPAYDPLVGKFVVLNFIDVLPRILRERDVSTRFFRLQSGNRRLDFDNAVAVLPDQHSADLGLGAGVRMLANLSCNFAVDQQSWLTDIRIRLLRHTAALSAARSPSTVRASPYGM